MSNQRHELIIFEKYKAKGETRWKAHKVGSAFPAKNGGFTLYIPPGVALTGRVVMVPPEKADMSEIDLLQAYQSAAEDYGL